jgi:membrane-associated protein
VLFAVVFAETGLVVAPFLPGDSLLFAGGAVSAAGLLNVWVLAGAMLVAAVAGDAANYLIGRRFGRAILRRGSRLIKRQHVEKASAFFERHGGRAIVLARFVPVVRTFAPFVAGMCEMPIGRFWAYNVSGAIVWVALFTSAGFFFGKLPWVEENLALGMGLVVFASMIPVVIEGARRLWLASRSAEPAVAED